MALPDTLKVTALEELSTGIKSQTNVDLRVGGVQLILSFLPTLLAGGF